MEKIIEIKGTIFEILIAAHKMTHVSDNIYMDQEGNKWHLTKYGLEPNEKYSQSEWNNVLIKKNKEINNLDKKVVNLHVEISTWERKVNHHKTEKEAVRKKLENCKNK